MASAPAWWRKQVRTDDGVVPCTIAHKEHMCNEANSALDNCSCCLKDLCAHVVHHRLLHQLLERGWQEAVDLIAGFPVSFLSGFSVAAGRAGCPDTGMLSYAEVLDSARCAVEVRPASHRTYTCLQARPSEAVRRLPRHRPDVIGHSAGLGLPRC